MQEQVVISLQQADPQSRDIFCPFFSMFSFPYSINSKTMEDILSFCEQSAADFSENWVRETRALEGNQHRRVRLYLPADRRTKAAAKIFS